jgi:hypothetical protein
MIVAEEQSVADGNDNRIAVPLNVGEYWRLLNALEEIESIRACDAAAAVRWNAIPFDIAVWKLHHYLAGLRQS